MELPARRTARSSVSPSIFGLAREPPWAFLWVCGSEWMLDLGGSLRMPITVAAVRRAGKVGGGEVNFFDVSWSLAKE